MTGALPQLGRWLPPIALMALIYWLSDQPDLNSGLGLVDLIGRKVIHMTEYGLLTFLLWRPLRELMQAPQAAALSFAIAVVYSVTDEYHQTFTAGRHGAFSDVLIDALGAALVALWMLRRSRRSERAA